MTKHFTSRQLIHLFILFSVILALGASSLPFIKNLKLSNDFRVYFSADNPQLQAFDQFEAEFASHDSLALIAYDDNRSWIDNEQLSTVEKFTEAFWSLPYATRVNSLTNYQYTYAEEDTLTTLYLSELGDRNAIKQALQSDPQLADTYISNDETVTIVQANMEFPDAEPDAARKAYDAAQQMLEQWQADYPSVTFYIVGSAVSNVTLEEAVKNDLALLVPLSYLIITLGLLYFLRSIKATVITLAVVTLSIVFTFSIFAIFKTELTPVAGFVPSIVLTLAVADCVHYLTSYRYLMVHEHKSAHEANKQAFDINLMPITITSITTAIGVLFLNFSDSPPYRDLGNMVAIGVTLAWLFTITLLPVILNRFPIHYSQGSKEKKEWIVKYSQWLIRYRGRLFTVIMITLAVAIWGLTQNTVTENWSKYFSNEFQIARAIDLLKEKFGRLHRYELVIESTEENAINSPEYLATLDSLLSYLDKQADVKHIQSYGLLLKRLNQNMHGDDPSYFVMPESQELAAQYLLLYELSLPQGLGVDTLVNFNRSASRTSILLRPLDSNQLIALENELQAYFQSLPHADKFTLHISGLDQIFAHIAHRNILSMLISSAVALIIISFLLTIILRSAKYGLISLIPNLIPGVMAYGIWGFTIGYIDLALSVVICMSLGIIVDDSVHFITKYLRAKRENQSSADHSLDHAFHIVGRALITTTVILVAGFATLLASPLTPTSHTGALLCITLVVAIIVDFTLLPIVLYWFDKKRSKSQMTELGN